jgi:hypothetical protein
MSANCWGNAVNGDRNIPSHRSMNRARGAGDAVAIAGRTKEAGRSALKLVSAFICGAALAAVVAPASASAEVWRYSYTGNDFTNVNQPFTTSDSIKFQFTSTALLGDDLNDAGFSDPILQWSLSLGPLSYSSANSVLYSLNFSTDAIGKITTYQFTTQTDVVAPGLLPAEYPPTPYEEEVFSFDLPGQFGVADGIYIPSIHQDSYYSYNSGAPGSWAVSAVPESSTWAMLCFGFAVLGIAGYRKAKSERTIAALA